MRGCLILLKKCVCVHVHTHLEFTHSLNQKSKVLVPGLCTSEHSTICSDLLGLKILNRTRQFPTAVLLLLLFCTIINRTLS